MDKVQLSIDHKSQCDPDQIKNGVSDHRLPGRPLAQIRPAIECHRPQIGALVYKLMDERIAAMALRGMSSDCSA
jgi:hypothetical protein